MAKVTALFKRDSVQNCLCDAADMGLTEVALIGKKQDGGFYIRLSPCENAYVLIGMLEALKHDYLTALEESATEG